MAGVRDNVVDKGNTETFQELYKENKSRLRVGREGEHILSKEKRGYLQYRLAYERGV